MLKYQLVALSDRTVLGYFVDQRKDETAASTSLKQPMHVKLFIYCCKHLLCGMLIFRVTS
jgi:hypothetical protein